MQTETIRYKRAAEPNNRSEKTRIRLLNAASRIFAEKGFQESTVAEICKQADVNVAAINYHFGDKETIYLEAWRYSFRRELTQFPPDGGISQFSAPEERLAGRIRSLIERIADEQSHSFVILYREMVSPSRVLSKILDQELFPLRMQMLQLIRECLGFNADERRIQYCYASIIGQCFQLLWFRHSDNTVKYPGAPSLDDVEAFADHVVSFSLAGVKSLRQDSTN